MRKNFKTGDFVRLKESFQVVDTYEAHSGFKKSDYVIVLVEGEYVHLLKDKIRRSNNES